MAYQKLVLVFLLVICSQFESDLANPVPVEGGAVVAAEAVTSKTTAAVAATTAVPSNVTAANNETAAPTTAGPTNAPSTAAPTTANPATTDSPTTAAPEPKPVTLKMTIKMEGVTKTQCEEVKTAQAATTPAPTAAAATTAASGNATAAPTVAPTEAPTAAPTTATTVASNATEAANTTASATEAPTVATTAASGTRKRRDASSFNANSFVESAQKAFKELIKKSGGENVTVTVSNIVCGSISMDTEIQGSITKPVEEFKKDVETQASTNPVSIQGIAVAPAELKAAVSSIQEVKTDPEVTTGGLSGGAIAGIVIGVLLLLVLVGIVLFSLKKSHRKSATINSTSRVKLSDVNDH